jgi:hypothetical protein
MQASAGGDWMVNAIYNTRRLEAFRRSAKMTEMMDFQHQQI